MLQLDYQSRESILPFPESESVLESAGCAINVPVKIQKDNCSITYNFKVPFRLERKEHYPVWHYHVLEQIRLCLGDHTVAKFAEYIHNREGSLDYLSVKDVINLDRIADVLLRYGVFHEINAYENSLERFRAVHHALCTFNAEEYRVYLAFWAREIEKDDEWLSPANSKNHEHIAANRFTPYDLYLMKNILNDEDETRRALSYYICQFGGINVGGHACLTIADRVYQMSQEIGGACPEEALKGLSDGKRQLEVSQVKSDIANEYRRDEEENDKRGKRRRV